MAKFDFTLTDTDIQLTTEFMMATHDKEYFCSDDFRKARLHLKCTLNKCAYPRHSRLHRRCYSNGERCRYINMQDPQHEIGAYFAKLKANGVVVPVGEDASKIASNNRRKVDLFRWDWRRWRGIVHGRLEAFL